MALRVFVLGLLSLACLVGCGKSDDEDDGPLLAQVSGTIQLPLSASRVNLFKGGKAGYYLSATWESCTLAGQANKSTVVAGGAVVLESTNSCTGAQYVSVTAQELIDLGAYVAGSLSFTVEANNAGQALQLLLQDGSTKTTIPVDLAGYGFDATKIGVAQQIKVPGATLATNGIDMTKLKRPFQVTVSCGTTSCQTKFDDIHWSGATATTAAMALSQFPRPNRCRTQPCRPVRYAPIALIRTLATGWQAAPAVIGVTSDTGTFGFPIGIDGDSPAFLVASDPDSGVNFIAQLPLGDLNNGGLTDTTVDVDLATTLAAQAQFPGGDLDGPDTFEREDDQLAAFFDVFDTFFENHPPTSPDPATQLAAALADPSVAKALNDARAAAAKGPAVPAQIVSANLATPLPTVSSEKPTESTPAAGKGTSSTFPGDVPTGTYELTGIACVDGSCQTIPAQTLTNSDPAQFEQAFKQGVAPGCSQAVEGTTCSLTYTAFDGTQFKAQVEIKACSEGTCVTSSITYVFTKKS